MQSYRDLDGDSGASAYESSPGRILVEFKDGHVYEYIDASAGAANVAQMQRLAAAGDGLNAFINSHVRNRYSRRVR